MSHPISLTEIPLKWKNHDFNSSASLSQSRGETSHEPEKINIDKKSEAKAVAKSGLPQKTKSLAQLAEEHLLKQLSNAVDGYQSTASYCCGGSIPISLSSKPQESDDANGAFKMAAGPMVICWDVPNHAGHSRKISFPSSLTKKGSLRSKSTATTDIGQSFEELLQACAPATFGLKKRDVLDENYRKAGKMDREQFAVDFHPHDHGIIDAVGQILLPEIRTTFLKDREEHRGVVAELYKLNIYSGPEGKFKTHVDTPRVLTQFGSLVVCLPYPHEGGKLRVSHKGHSSFFDWSQNDESPAAIQWAAFYSDCEHEMLPVTSGHRLTLTYNLYVTEHTGSILQPSLPSADPSLLPLFSGAEQMLAQPNFMPNGGNLGFYCTHKYAHHTKEASKLLPWALKGVDVAIFSVFRSLGLKVTVRPALDKDDDKIRNLEYGGEDPDDRSDSKSGSEVGSESGSDGGSDKRSDKSNDSNRRRKKRDIADYIGDKLHPLKLSDTGRWDMNWYEEEENIRTEWPLTRVKNIIWLNSPQQEGWETALVNLTYGNEASLNWFYSHAVIIIEVPSRARRLRKGEDLADEEDDEDEDIEVDD